MPQSDAFVFFGATGDLAFKQIFPALQRLVRDEGLNMPIIGVAKAGWNLDQLRRAPRTALRSTAAPIRMRWEIDGPAALRGW
jgi:glucose-6-phosphate 1-dehydrogenase